MSFMSRERLISGGVALIFLGLVSFFGLRWFEHAVTFHPVRYHADNWTSPGGAQDVFITSADGVRLHGWFIETKKRPAVATIIFFHGNGGNISNVGWVGEKLSSRGLDVLLLDYRGYGRSDGQMTSEADVYADAEAGYQYVTSTRGVSPENIVLYGQSLGTAPVADLASRKECAAIILESGFSSASDLALNVLPWFPRRLHFLTRNRFESAQKLSQVKCPVLITHGDPDETIPTEHGQRLFDAANEPKKLLIFPGAGHNVFGSQGDRYLDLMADFVQDSTRPNK
jgi:uncharacterized protein